MQDTVKGPRPVVKNSQLGGYEMKQALSKLANAPMSAQAARSLRRILKEIQEKTETVSNQYREEILKVHFKHDEKGEPVMENGDYVPNDQSPEFTEKLKALNDEFGERTVEISEYIKPFMLGEVRGVTAREMDVLEVLIAEENGPGIPPNVSPIR